jgi:DNA-binding response OmpR family regulator
MDRILLVDDNPAIRDLLRSLLEEWNYLAFTAATLAEARQAVVTLGPFRVVICDFDLPDGNGLQFLDWLRWERREHGAFLLISGSSDFDVDHASDFSFLAKPFRMEELCGRLEELTAGKSQAS